MFTQFPCACLGSFQLLQLPPTVQCTVRLPGDSKLAIGVNLNSCLFLCVSPVTVCQAVQGVPHLIPHDNLNSNISDNSKADMGKIDGWMDYKIITPANG